MTWNEEDEGGRRFVVDGVVAVVGVNPVVGDVVAGMCVCLLLQVMMIVLLLFLQKQKLANAIYLFGLGTLLVQSCLRGGGRDIGGHVLRETTNRGLCGLVCPSRTCERGGEGDCVK